MYTAVVLNDDDRNKLLSMTRGMCPPWWHEYAHHCTIDMQPATKSLCKDRLGEEIEMTIKSFALGDRVAAVGIEMDVPSANAIKHITIAVDTDAGGKPKHSNDLKDWVPITEFTVKGHIAECA